MDSGSKKEIPVKAVLAIFLLPIFIVAQNQPPAVASACGVEKTSMSVDLDRSQHLIEQPETGKARIYFIQQTGLDEAGIVMGLPTTKIGIDGQWVGANKKDSYFSVSVEPGEHHLCMALQSSLGEVELAHLVVEAGRVYYYRTRIISSERPPFIYLDLNQIDSDEAEHLIASDQLARAHIK